MSAAANRIEFELPAWAGVYAADAAPMPSLEERMAFVVGAAQRNIEHRTGGPFAAAVFERDTGVLVSLGVNLVTTAGLSILHAEIVALALAQKRLAAFDLGAAGAAHELVSSAEPCAMCLGAIPWSGAVRLVAGARGTDVERFGFDEGAKPEDWAGALRARGIEVVVDVGRDKAAAVIADYAGGGGRMY